MRKTTLAAALAIAALAAPLSAETPAGAFEKLKQLAGRWEGHTMTPDGAPGAVVYDVTSAGSVVRERLFPDTPHEMMTVYYMDGADLVAVHYCAAGNQPRLKFVPSDTKDLAFDFAGGANVDAKKGSHMHAVRFHMPDADHLESEWDGWKDGAKDHTAKFFLARKKN